MLGLKKFINSGQQHHAVQENQAVTNLIQRIGESLVVEDRRSAIQELASILADDPPAQSAFASVGFPTICSAIQMDRDDPTVVRTSLECIALAVAPEHTQDGQVRFKFDIRVHHCPNINHQICHCRFPVLPLLMQSNLQELTVPFLSY